MTGFSSSKSTRIVGNSNALRNCGCSDFRGVDELPNKTRIKFTRKFTNQYKTCCWVLTALIICLLSLCVVLYCGYYYVKVEPGEELSFHGSFTVVREDSYLPTRFNSSSELYYVKALQTALQVQPSLRLSFLSADILALDGENETNTTVHFEIKFNPRLLFGVDLQELINILKHNLRIPDGLVDVDTLSLKEVHTASMMSSSSLSPRFPPPSHILDDSFSNIRAQCAPASQLPFCPDVGKNLTSFPNLLMHKNADDVLHDLIIFRELIDAECFDHAAEFLCLVLQPKCVPRPDSSIETFLPCQKFCNEFQAGCGDRFTERLRRSLDCVKFPEYSQFGRSCQKQPNCNVASLKTNEQFSYSLCDGVIDCVDLEDELSCSYCGGDDFHCGLSKNCIPKTSYCDGNLDCPDGSDEKTCFTLSPTVTPTNLDQKTALDTLNYEEGYAVHTKKGAPFLVCVDNENTDESTLQKMGETFCKSNSYQKVKQAKVLPIENTALSWENYVQLQYGEDSELEFSYSTNCSSNHLLYVSCSEIECGLQTTRANTSALDGLNKIAVAGDWPWYAALHKNGVHSCDATVISEQWLLTTVSCFQGQEKAEWIAKVGAIRLYGKSPWQQEKHVIGMVKSPVEGSTLVLIKLSNPVIYSYFVRPVCLPFNHPPIEELTYCNALGWSKNKGMLQRIEIQETPMDNCADMSITINNGLCAASAFGTDECNEEEMAGSALICLTSEQSKWALTGISNWRITCTPTEMQRPRLYDKVVSNVNWIRSVINSP